MSSDEGTGTGRATEKNALSEREEQVAKLAWHCLKSGPPEIDVEKLKEMGNFKTTKTASNTWGVVKKKLFAESEGDTVPSTPKKVKESASTPKTPKTPKTVKKGTATPKKRGKKVASDDEDSDEARTVRKRSKVTPLKNEVKVEAEDEI